MSGVASGIGITAGAHRLWSHRSYKAKLPLRILLLIFYTMAYQYSLINWARDHRVHHKFTDTNADPHNIKRYRIYLLIRLTDQSFHFGTKIFEQPFRFSLCRGFFFAHVGWLLCERHSENIAKSNEMDVSDLENDPLLRIQHK